MDNDKAIGWIDNEVPPPTLLVSPINNRINNGDNGESNQQRNEIILSVFYQDLKIGIAYYNRLESNIYLCQSWEDDNFSCLHLIKQQTNPKVIIIPSRMPQRFVDSIQRNSNCFGPENINSDEEKKNELVTDFYFARFSDFTYESSKNRLLNIKLSTCNSNNSLVKLKFLQNIIDFDNIEMIRAIGGLLSYLSKHVLLDEFDSLENLLINEICPIPLDQYLLLENNDLYSLQIFSNKNHPSFYSKGNSKEGLSLFALFDKTKTSMGKKLLKTWFMRPSRNRNIIEERQSLIEYFSLQENQSIKSELQDYLKNIKDLRIIINRIFSSQNPLKDFISIYKTFHFFVKIKLLINSKNPTLPFLKNVKDLYPNELVNIYQKFENIFCFDQDDRVSIKEGFNDKLDHLRNVYLSMDQILTQHGKQERVKLQNISWVSSFHLVYYPQLGCLICIPVDNTLSISKQINIPTLKFTFKTTNYLYFQNEKTKELDDFFGDIHNDILDIHSKIERDFIDEIIANGKSIIDIINFSSQLDCVLSLSSAIKSYDLVRPTISSEVQVIDIKDGRHLIQEQVTDNFIPNDTINHSNKPIIIVSGPNQSGKSIYIKQVALIVFLAQIGSFVPASKATISIFDKIYTRITSRESNSVSESSFMIDCKQISLMTRFSTNKSLFIIDEYGKGTNPLDGISLLYGFIVFLLSKETTTKTFICTHFYEFFELLANSKELLEKVLFNTMDYLLPNNNQNNQHFQIDNLEKIFYKSNEFIPFYKLKEGVSNSSFGMICAKNAGISSDIIERAYEIMEHQKQFKTIECSKFKPIPLNQNQIEKYNNLLDFFEQFDPNKDNIQHLFNILNK
ncbi:hypothetical protein DICPUDRAFT_88710 [Dictyostelium purpureum]|uniref:DNA mismatch repair proteins mutS family domain-containing protein n=1 Tax=Dictyostelium purpureum TaxID=5786 RepID=F0ZR50_DICPU|nr:uncharacterized protein DICPUDRAFT_88710 [Dictyostelium purpureum]EGC33574.1 hypothetical protein DICPUDRAFT_88710 [Dictyostelium purpureum]|eukprot:XP_003289889.1 hypothetical protein DICPUDRAFT_88710 [Dictyostelium purpureum]